MAIKMMVCCASGAGSSLLMKMTTQKAIDNLGISVSDLHHCAISEAKSASLNYDVVLCARNFEHLFEEAKKKGVKVIGLKNVMSQKEIEAKLKRAGIA
ncbi:PTS sugar transporter subunit IIB [Kandleria vitulina]|jgi:PTS system ascorbate-specific IIB component|uniref:PTS sugar transporter subunit IIB n=1 Tax=Kandleria vitulina TaxID=1630 RepID=UPI003325C313